jgi:hypothetical protein
MHIILFNILSLTLSTNTSSTMFTTCTLPPLNDMMTYCHPLVSHYRYIISSFQWLFISILSCFNFIMKMKWEIKVMTWDRLRNVAEFCVFIFNELTREEIVRFVDIGGFIDHHSYPQEIYLYLILIRFFKR